MQLDSIRKLDQKYREDLWLVNMSQSKKDSIAKIYGKGSDQIEMYLWGMQRIVDQSNLEFITRIIKSQGYPGKSIVGDTTNVVGWSIIQHSTQIKDFIEIIEVAAKEGELPFAYYGTMLDRYLMEQGKPQRYGTQIASKVDEKGISKKYLWPVENFNELNKLRKEAGFKLSIEDYLQNMGIDNESVREYK